MSLVTVDEVKLFIQADEKDTDEDDVIKSLLEPCSQAITGYTHREFEKEDGETRVFAHPGGRIFDLVPYDLRVVKGIEVGTETESPTTLAATDYQLRPMPARHDVYQRVRLGTNPGPCEITVEGDWGFAEVPEDIKHCAITTIALWLRREVQAFERTVQLDSDRLERPEALPSAIRGRLAGWRRPALP